MDENERPAEPAEPQQAAPPPLPDPPALPDVHPGLERRGRDVDSVEFKTERPRRRGEE